MAFHARVGVRQGDTVHIVTGTLDDWCTTDEFLEIAAQSLGVTTAGEIVQQLSNPVKHAVPAHDLKLQVDDLPVYEEVEWTKCLNPQTT